MAAVDSVAERLHPFAIAGGVAGLGKRILGHTAPGRYITGSDSPAFIRLTSSKRPDIDPDSIDWNTLDADPEAGSWPRHRHNVGILATSHSLYNQVDTDFLQVPGNVKDAIAWVSEGVVNLGINPAGDNLFGGGSIEGESKFALARRLEQAEVQATIGLLLVEEQRFIPADSVSVVEPSLPIDDILGENFRHVPVV